MSLRHNHSTPNFPKIRETPGNARRPRSRREQRSGNAPIYYMIVRQKPEQVFVFTKLYAANLNFHFLTYNN